MYVETARRADATPRAKDGKGSGEGVVRSAAWRALLSRMAGRGSLRGSPFFHSIGGLALRSKLGIAPYSCVCLCLSVPLLV